MAGVGVQQFLGHRHGPAQLGPCRLPGALVTHLIRAPSTVGAALAVALLADCQVGRVPDAELRAAWKPVLWHG
jgi:hypothetical protein